MVINRRTWIRRALIAGAAGLGAQQIWRHGHDYVFLEQFRVVEPGRIYRGAWQQPWPMRRIIRRYHIRTILALAHPPTNPLVGREQALATLREAIALYTRDEARLRGYPASGW